MFSDIKTLERSASDSEKSSRYITVQNMLEGAFWLAAQTPHTFCYILRAFVTENIVIVAGMNELQSYFCALSSHCFIIY